MEKLELKNKVIDWLNSEGIELKDRKIRVYKYRNEWEVRIYNEPMFLPNSKKSRRKIETDGYGNNCTYGIHTTKISTYTHISESDLNSKEERIYILEALKML